MNKKKLGILGGGQLGMFMCQAAKRNNIHTIVFSNTKNFSAKSFCDSYFVADFDNKKILKEFIESSDFITIETENIPKHILKEIESKKKLFPSSFIIEICQNRLKEKNFLNSLDGVSTVKYKTILNFNDLKESLKSFNNKAILKSCEMGYDGKGQFLICNKNINQFKEMSFKDFILEEKIDFEKEISVIVCRTKKKIITYPPVENLHKESILRETTYPAAINKSSERMAIFIAKKISIELELEGILAIEMFVMKDNSILVNEIAPRPHNSGHWTLDYCKFSQFDNLLMAIFNSSVESPMPIMNCKMVNVIGKEYKKKNDFIQNYKFYDYYKDEIKELRKMGHYTFKC